MILFDADKPKRRPHPRDEQWHELFKAAEAAFYPSGIADGQRARVANLIDDLRQKGATAGNFAKRKARYHELFPNAVCTLPAMLNQWDACEAVRTRQPGMPTEAEQMQRRYENACDDRRLEAEQHARDAARQIVLAAPAGVAEKLYKEWKALPENANVVKYGATQSCGSPTSMMCVCWIAERIEAM